MCILWLFCLADDREDLEVKNGPFAVSIVKALISFMIIESFSLLLSLYFLNSKKRLINLSPFCYLKEYLLGVDLGLSCLF